MLLSKKTSENQRPEINEATSISGPWGTAHFGSEIHHTREETTFAPPPNRRRGSQQNESAADNQRQYTERVDVSGTSIAEVGVMLGLIGAGIMFTYKAGKTMYDWATGGDNNPSPSSNAQANQPRRPTP